MPPPTDPPQIFSHLVGEDPADLRRVSLAAACRFPEFHQRVTPHLLNRWCGRGVRGVKLDSELIGDRRYTWRAAVREFLATLNCRPTHAERVERQDWVRRRLAEARI